MRILLIGEYSNLHWTLAQGLRKLGHQVTVASDGDGFKQYPRDIDLERKSSNLKDTAATLLAVLKNLKNFKGYDVVQLINPCFTQLNIAVNKYLYRYLKRHNKTIFLGAFGIDAFWVSAASDNRTFRYTEFFINGKENKLADNERVKKTWLNTAYEALNREIADSCNGIIACLFEYYTAYKPYYEQKLTYIPLPINTDMIQLSVSRPHDKVIFFLGINKARNEFKGTDKLYRGLLALQKKYPEEVALSVVESVRYDEYTKALAASHAAIDQLYSYTPAVNGLTALAMGKTLLSGAEPEMYQLLGEELNHPIINVFPSEEDIFNKLEYIVLNKDKLPQWSLDGRQFVEKHHDYIAIARQYLDFWEKQKTLS
ncbi:MAG: glycosyltransferase family 1 protein [Prevotella sp.]|jgi:glycosyltransferase involved in cell wall biosynthesis|nr:glycosyltransferase family 1 protein [Prevotella sp.]